MAKVKEEEPPLKQRMGPKSLAKLADWARAGDKEASAYGNCCLLGAIVSAAITDPSITTNAPPDFLRNAELRDVAIEVDDDADGNTCYMNVVAGPRGYGKDPEKEKSKTNLGPEQESLRAELLAVLYYVDESTDGEVGEEAAVAVAESRRRPWYKEDEQDKLVATLSETGGSASGLLYLPGAEARDT